MMWSFFLIVSLLCLVHGERFSIEKRAHSKSCPLGNTGPGEDFFFEKPNLLTGNLLDGRCSSVQFLQSDDPTCCQANYLNAAQAEVMEDPFGTAAREVLVDISFACETKLSTFTCGLCRTHQDSFVQNYTTYSEVRLCLSFCQDLLASCDGDKVRVPGETVDSIASHSYGDDAAQFCYDLFATVENVQVSVSLDVADDGTTPSQFWRSLCFSDVRQCDESDIESFYTECDHEDNFRSVYHRYKEDSDCRGGEPLPNPILELPCYQTCDPGYYVPIGDPSCAPCPGGTQSIPGYYIVYWKDWPTEMDFNTYCEENNGNNEKPIRRIDGECAWNLNDTHIESGEGLKASRNSVLESTFVLVREGTITFEYKVFAELNYDGLFFYVDDDLVMPKISLARNWTEVTFPLLAGKHTVKWVFFKDKVDDTVIEVDMALINKIVVIGTTWADSECDPCPFGHHSESGERCSRCPVNTYADEEGLANCKPCPSTQYSMVGAEECLERVPCTTDDVTTFHTPCEDNSRIEYVKANQPIFCDETTWGSLIPENKTVGCAKCNPGYFRNEDECEPCAPGYHSSSAGAAECLLCPAGTYAPKTLVYTQFEHWSELEGLETHCEGDCASLKTAWRLLGDDLDSGVGHGNVADSFLTINFHLDRFGMVNFFYSYSCTSACHFQVRGVGLIENEHLYSDGDTGPHFHQVWKLFTPGDHTLQIIFSKFDSYVVGNAFDRLIIHNISISGVSTGGAVNCENCRSGSYSEAGADSCLECPIGESSQGGDAECTPCGEESYSNETGAPYCRDCPPGSKSTADRTDCDHNDCVYSPIPGVVYNLSALGATSTDDIYGPVVDQTNHTFYINPCGREAMASNCWDSNGKSLMTHACQYVPPPYDFTMDLGSQLGYLPLNDTELSDDPIRSGLIMTFTQGTPGCPDWSNLIFPRPRDTFITFICNPAAGRGSPVAVEPVENPSCTYNFRWVSAYACPQCTIDDYILFHGHCIGGKRSKYYVPKNFPNRCTGGLSTPPPSEDIPCENANQECPPGTYLPMDAEDGKCADASAGHYSIGAGFVFDKFESYDSMEPAIFEKGSWLMLDDFIRSGNGDTEFSVNVFLLQAGHVYFRYKVFAPLLEDDEADNPGFRFFVDSNEVMMSQSTDYRYEKKFVELSSGEHKLQWRFTGGDIPTRQNRGNYAVVDEIHILGVSFAARNDIPCPGGTYQPHTGQTSCIPCPKNTRSNSGAEVCSDCHSTEYSFPGSQFCETRKRCEGRDLVSRTTDCGLDTTTYTQYYDFLQPQICLEDGSLSIPQNETLDCLDCPLGYPLNDKVKECTPCPLGFILDSTQVFCEPAPKGSVALLTHTYFPTSPQPRKVFTDFKRGENLDGEDEEDEGDEGDELPTGFSTVSSPGTVPWRLLNNSLGSGYHSVVETDSILYLNVSILQEGSIEFSYSLSSLREEEDGGEEEEEDPMLDGLQFFINGKLQVDNALPYHPEENIVHTPSFYLEYLNERTPYQFEWVYHQPYGARQRSRIILSDIRVMGDERGTSFSPSKCERGTYSAGQANNCELCDVGHYADQPGMGECSLCPEGTFTNQYGTPECETCGKGTNSSDDRLRCDISDCVFGATNDTKFNLTSLSQHVRIDDGDNSTLVYELSICNFVPPRDTSCFEANRAMETYTCSIESGVAQDTGRIANVYYVGEALRIQYNRGHFCGENEDAHTIVDFICDVTQLGPIGNITVEQKSKCETKIEWRNVASCRVCTPDDYLKQNSECEDNTQTVSYVKAVPCNGPIVVQNQTKGCSETVSVTLPIVLGSVGLFILLLCVVVVVAIRNKKLAERYEMLVNESQRASGPPRESGEVELRDLEK